jgi:WD40 repeat protein
VSAIAWNPNSTSDELAVANINGYISIYGVTSTEIQSSRLSILGTAPRMSVAWNADGGKLAGGDDNGTIELWDAVTGDLLDTLLGHTDLVSALAWSRDNNRLASASRDGTVRVWDVARRQTLEILSNAKVTLSTSISWSPDGSRLAFGRANSEIEIIRFPTAEAGHYQTVTDGDGDGSGSSDRDGTIVSYEWSEGGASIASGINPQISLSVGVHTITLTVTDDDGATDTDEVVITVDPPPGG